MTSLIKHKESLLKLILAGLLLLFALLTCYVFLHGKYRLAQEDEATYYNGARVFAETGWVRAARTNTETVSKIWQCDWYGPMYHIFFGSVDKIAGVHDYNFIITNLICFMLIIALVMRASFTIEQKLLIICSLLSLHYIVGYIFTYFPQTVELLFATILTLLLRQLFYLKPESKEYKKKYLLYILLVIFFSLFKVTIVLWIFGLLAFSVSKKDFLQKLGIGIGCGILIYIYMLYFNAPYAPKTGMAQITQGALGFRTIFFLIKRLAENILVYCTHNPFYDNFQGIIFLIAIYSCAVTKNKLLLAACIISFLYYIILTTLYLIAPFYFNKQTACLYILLFIAFYTATAPVSRYAMFSLILLFSPITYFESYSLAKERKEMAIQNDMAKPFISQIEQLKNKIEGGKERTVLTLYKEFDDKIPFEVFETNLPAATTDRFPILFTYNFSNNIKVDGNNPYELNFVTKGKIHIDYILSKYPLKIDSTSLTYSCNSFYLYKNLKKVN